MYLDVFKHLKSTLPDLFFKTAIIVPRKSCCFKLLQWYAYNLHLWALIITANAWA